MHLNLVDVYEAYGGTRFRRFITSDLTSAVVSRRIDTEDILEDVQHSDKQKNTREEQNGHVTERSSDLLATSQAARGCLAVTSRITSAHTIALVITKGRPADAIVLASDILTVVHGCFTMGTAPAFVAYARECPACRIDARTCWRTRESYEIGWNEEIRYRCFGKW